MSHQNRSKWQEKSWQEASTERREQTTNNPKRERHDNSWTQTEESRGSSSSNAPWSYNKKLKKDEEWRERRKEEAKDGHCCPSRASVDGSKKWEEKHLERLEGIFDRARKDCSQRGDVKKAPWEQRERGEQSEAKSSNEQPPKATQGN